jgi:hypothetical protein
MFGTHSGLQVQALRVRRRSSPDVVHTNRKEKHR